MRMEMGTRIYKTTLIISIHLQFMNWIPPNINQPITYPTRKLQTPLYTASTTI